MQYGKNYARLQMYAREQANILYRRLGVNDEGLITSGSTTLIGEQVRITPTVERSTHPEIYCAYVSVEILRGNQWCPLSPFGAIDPVQNLASLDQAFHEGPVQSGMGHLQRVHSPDNA